MKVLIGNIIEKKFIDEVKIDIGDKRVEEKQRQKNTEKTCHQNHNIFQAKLYILRTV